MQRPRDRRDERRVNAAAQENREVHVHVALPPDSLAKYEVKCIERRMLLRGLDIVPAPISEWRIPCRINLDDAAGRNFLDVGERRIGRGKITESQVSAQRVLVQRCGQFAAGHDAGYLGGENGFAAALREEEWPFARPVANQSEAVMARIPNGDGKCADQPAGKRLAQFQI